MASEDLMWDLEEDVYKSPPVPLSLSRPLQPIERLPHEILLFIFHRCVETQIEVRDLALTCRDWHHVVEANPSLRGHIHYKGPSDSYEAHWLKQGGYCVTPEQLTRAIERVKEAPFTLSFHNHTSWDDSPSEPWSDVPWHRFTGQCTGLTFFSDSIIDPVLSHLPPLHRLRYFEDHSICGSGPLLSQILLANPQLELYHLTIPPIEVDPSLLHRIATTLKSCKFRNMVQHESDYYIPLLSAFRDLEELEWLNTSELPAGIGDPVSWSFSPKVLKTDKIIPCIFPSRLLQALVELDIHSDKKLPPNYQEMTPSLTLPALTRLFLKGQWLELIQIHAPILQSLTLRSTPQPELITHLLKTSLRPLSLDIVDGHYGMILINMDPPRAHENPEILSLLAGSAKKPPICPHIRHLVVAFSRAMTPKRYNKLDTAIRDAIGRRRGTSPIISVRSFVDESVRD
ncbi:hypothetical protein FRC17_009757 [Serendipita sp. 399]|nr:hypothetical protein FRC17_009757 [Serendipita sp. 399]